MEKDRNIRYTARRDADINRNNAKSSSANRPENAPYSKQRNTFDGNGRSTGNAYGNVRAERGGNTFPQRRQGAQQNVRFTARRPGGERRGGSNLPYVDTKAKREIAEAEKERNWQLQVERTKGGVDKVLLMVLIVILVFGALMMYSASYPTALEEGSDSFAYLKKQLLFMGLGAVFMAALTFIPHRLYKKWGPLAAYGITLVFLVAVLVMGSSEGEAKRWLYLGPVSVQPSEMLKLSLILVLAWYLDKFQKEVKEASTFKKKITYSAFYPLCFVGLGCALVLLEKHLSGTLIIGFLGLAVMIVGGCHIGYSLALTAIGGTAAAGLFLIMNPYALERVKTFFSSTVNAQDEGWQTAQGVNALGSGGLFGVGYSESRQKFSYVSKAHNDFIFSIVGEELGFVGCVVLIILFLLLIWRGYRIALRAPDTFTSLVAFGITTQIGIQAFLNMMVVCDIIPNTGISLPFFSYGGSSLLMLMIEMGFLLYISKHSYRKKGDNS